MTPSGCATSSLIERVVARSREKRRMPRPSALVWAVYRACRIRRSMTHRRSASGPSLCWPGSLTAPSAPSGSFGASIAPSAWTGGGVAIPPQEWVDIKLVLGHGDREPDEIRTHDLCLRRAARRVPIGLHHGLHICVADCKNTHGTDVTNALETGAVATRQAVHSCSPHHEV